MLIDIDFLKSDQWVTIKENSSVVVVSGGMDPVHEGHLKCFEQARTFGDKLVVIVNGNLSMIRRKGFFSYDENERAKYVNKIADVDYTLIWDEDSLCVDRALQLIKPDCFAKGGTISGDYVIPRQELEVCRAIGCEIKYGVGGRYKNTDSNEMIELGKILNKIGF